MSEKSHRTEGAEEKDNADTAEDAPAINDSKVHDDDLQVPARQLEKQHN